MQTRVNESDHNFSYTKPFLFFLFLRERQVSFKIHNSWPSETIDVGVIRVCGTAELEENLPRNTDFLQFFDGTTEFFIPAGCGFSRKWYTECGILKNIYRFAEFFTYCLAKRKPSLLGFPVSIIYPSNRRWSRWSRGLWRRHCMREWSRKRHIFVPITTTTTTTTGIFAPKRTHKQSSKMDDKVKVECVAFTMINRGRKPKISRRKINSIACWIQWWRVLPNCEKIFGKKVYLKMKL